MGIRSTTTNHPPQTTYYTPQTIHNKLQTTTNLQQTTPNLSQRPFEVNGSGDGQSCANDFVILKCKSTQL